MRKPLIWMAFLFIALGATYRIQNPALFAGRAGSIPAFGTNDNKVSRVFTSEAFFIEKYEIPHKYRTHFFKL